MAYIKPEEVKEIRKNLKKKYPNIKFSVRTLHYSVVDVTILESDINFDEVLKGREDAQLNASDNYNQYSDEINEVLNSIVKIMKGQGYYDNSDVMTDYFDVAYYMRLNIGRYDKPYIQK